MLLAGEEVLSGEQRLVMRGDEEGTEGGRRCELTRGAPPPRRLSPQPRRLRQGAPPHGYVRVQSSSRVGARVTGFLPHLHVRASLVREAQLHGMIASHCIRLTAACVTMGLRAIVELCVRPASRMASLACCGLQAGQGVS